LKLLFSANHHLIIKCAKCGFGQVAFEPNADEIDAIYQASYFSHNKYKDTKTLYRENRRRLALVGKYLTSDKAKLLEAGCGTGDFLFHSKSQFEVYGFDLSVFAIEKARENNPELSHRLLSGRIEDLEYPNAHFDAICLWDVIEHIWNPAQNIAHLMKYLKPNGYLFFSSPNFGSLIAKLLRRYWPFMTPPEHLSFFSKRSMNYLAEMLLESEMVYWSSKGKWANVGFILYKIKRIMPSLVPNWLIKIFQKRFVRNLAIYVPTGDILYSVVRKTTI
jgi:2-polyprenyl-3-methyl-5-hydroxy-6-metoxy-1,4-benzoquinol methylase